eukprot:GILI01037048.1.p2 GENE.GILI01037048.1~~GILI01037048.1.p2  ORF type:complete len:142 (+),score=12.40 GILI01037048.1:163-588(+)
MPTIFFIFILLLVLTRFPITPILLLLTFVIFLIATSLLMLCVLPTLVFEFNTLLFFRLFLLSPLLSPLLWLILFSTIFLRLGRHIGTNNILHFLSSLLIQTPFLNHQGGNHEDQGNQERNASREVKSREVVNTSQFTSNRK